MLTKALEACHEDEHTYKGGFCIDDIWYIPDSGTVEIRQKSVKELDQTNYILDLIALLTIIEMCFGYKNLGNVDRYPMHLEPLMKWIKSLTNTGTEHKSKVKRATVYLNPVGWSSAGRIMLFDGLMLHYHKLPKKDKTDFQIALGNVKSSSSGSRSSSNSISYTWKHRMTSTEMISFENNGPKNKRYPNHYFGRLGGVWFGVLKFNKHCSTFVLFDKKFSILD
jgi:hypothetical protein